MSCGRDDPTQRRKCPLESVSEPGAVRTLNSINDVQRFVNKHNDLLRKHIYLIHMLCTYSIVIHHSDVSSKHRPWCGTISSDYQWISCVSPDSLSLGLGLAMVAFPHFSFVFSSSFSSLYFIPLICFAFVLHSSARHSLCSPPIAVYVFLAVYFTPR